MVLGPFIYLGPTNFPFDQMDTDLPTAVAHVVWPSALPSSCVPAPLQQNLDWDTSKIFQVLCFSSLRQETRKELLNQLFSKFLLISLPTSMFVVSSTIASFLNQPWKFWTANCPIILLHYVTSKADHQNWPLRSHLWLKIQRFPLVIS